MQELRLKRSGNEGRGGLERSAPRFKTASNAVRITICIIVAAGLAATPLGAQSPTPVGVWLHSNKRIQVEIAPCGERLCGKMVWFRWPNDAQGLPLVDLNNPNPELRSRALLGLRILRGLRRAGERTWEGGKIYNPDDGVEYRALMSIGDDGALRVRAYLLLPILGKTLIWTRVR
jgi:uncharacterized protein (DUF2147 family)